MTLQELKDNRNDIIEIITDKVGTENVKKVMQLLVDFLGFNGIRSTTVEGYVKEVINLNGITPYIASAPLLTLNGETFTHLGDYNTARGRAYMSVK